MRREELRRTNNSADMALADWVHGKGLKIGIYSSPGPRPHRSKTGFRVESEDSSPWVFRPPLRKATSSS